ncbi:signal peptidase I [Vibrio parahaemolyticus]|uniref:Signal peptidase I n=1 Tax=Vibrio parahaemolyticus TaxID=670 RepID=A0AAW8Q2R1_VIBPH|nr:signal peptidase I [Vibrio parahaemolyticus]MDS1820768.1 signal peptidase I [Vibrio parahaemolyticus]
MKKNKIKGKFKISLSDILLVLAIIVIKGSFIDWYYIPSGSMQPTLKINDRVIVDMDAYDAKVPFTDITLMKKGEPERGDVIIFKEINSKQIYIKRVIGLSGDTIKVDGHNTYINGLKVESEKIGESDQFTKYRQTIEGKSFVAQYDKKLDILSTIISRVKSGLINPETPEVISLLEQRGMLRAGEWVVPEGSVFVMGDNRDHSQDSRFDSVSYISKSVVRGKADFVLANMEPLVVFDTQIPFIPASITDFNREIYSVE